MRRLRSQRGLTFIEVIAALAMLSVIYVAMTTLFAGSFTFVFAAGPRLTAIAEAQAILDDLYHPTFYENLYADPTLDPLNPMDVEEYIERQLEGSARFVFGQDKVTARHDPAVKNDLPAGSSQPVDEFDEYFRVLLTVVRNGRRADLSVLIPLRPPIGGGIAP